jgi:hypothetical protein
MYGESLNRLFNPFGSPPAHHEEEAALKPVPPGSPMAEPGFQQWFGNIVKARNAMGMPLDPNPNDPSYNYYGLYKTGWAPPANWGSPAMGEGRGHFPSSGFKQDSDERAILGGLDTRTGMQVAPSTYSGPMTPEIQRDAWMHMLGGAQPTKAGGW